MKGGPDSHKAMKRCLIALVFAVVLMALVTIAALYSTGSHLSGELTNFLHQLNESKEADRELTNDINLLSIQNQKSLSSTRDNSYIPGCSQS